LAALWESGVEAAALQNATAQRLALAGALERGA
jgi:hypothetical protein